MKIDLFIGRRVFKNGLVLATTLATCGALQANEHDKTGADKSHKEHADKGPVTVERFVQKAIASGQMEVQMGQLGQTQSQNQEVKTLAAAIVRDHTQANQKLQQIASSKNINAIHADDQAKHQKHMDKLKSASGAEFDKEFVKMALQHHKKGIAEFERAQNQITDQELKSFISETLPKLRQHQQMARTTARSLGIDEASIAAELDVDASSAAGAAAGAVSGSKEGQGRSLEKPRSSLDGASDTDTSGTINQNNPSVKAEAQIGDEELSATADAVDTNVKVESKEEVFEKGDGKVLGLPTSKTDGKFLGIIPNPRADKDKDGDIEVSADVDADADDASVGAAAKVETGTSKKDE